VLFHELLDTVFPDPHTLAKQLSPDPGPAVFAFAASMCSFDVRQHGLVAQAPAGL